MKKQNKSGHCQLCGRLQKIPGGKMAKHGYTREYGFFNGTCPGSDELPYEHSADLLPRRISQIKEMIDFMDLRISTVSSKKDFCHVRVYKDGIYQYVEAMVKVEYCKSQVTNETKPHFTLHDRETGEHFSQYRLIDFSSVEEIIVHHNQQYIEKVLKVRKKEYQDYLNWLSKRLDNWKYVEIPD